MQSLSSYHLPSKPLFLSSFVLLWLLIYPIYSNTLNASWHMDDQPNILDNRPLHIDNLMPPTLFQTFFASPGSIKKLYRPIPCLTFALNWYFGRDDPTGYHLVNILIHILTSFILFLLIFTLFQTPALKGLRTLQEAYFISFLSAVLWAINPIQTQAITYIVQRMAAMAAMFYLVGMLLYIKARMSNVNSKRTFLYLGCLISFLCAVGSKENAATLPLALVLLEIAFFQKSGRIDSKITIFRTAAWAFVLVFIAFIVIYTKGNLLFFLGGYAHRSFSLIERLLTEPRVVVYYLSQIFYPIPNRLSIDHTVPLSTSLTDPWTTMPAILFILALIIFGIFQIIIFFIL